jgi:hypothetical protein
MAASTPRIDKLDLISISNPSSNITLTSSDRRFQLVTPSADIDVTLPTTGITEGDVWEIQNTTASYLLTLKSSDTTQITRIGKGRIVFVAKQATPTSDSHWQIVHVSEYRELDASSSGNFDPSLDPVRISRENTQVILSFPSLTHPSSSNPGTSPGWLPTELRPFANIFNTYIALSSGTRTCFVNTSGQFACEFYNWSGTPTTRTSTGNGTICWTLDG